jgi:hypothetical protein
MKRLALAALVLAGCRAAPPAERYGFVARLGNDTVAVENVTRSGNTLTSDETDRFPVVRLRHTVVTFAPNGSVDRFVSDVHTPSDSAAHRDRHVTAEVRNDTVHLAKTDSSGTKTKVFATGGAVVVPHVDQMYSLYEQRFLAAHEHAAAAKKSTYTVHLRQFYVDREFDNFPLHSAVVRVLPNNKMEIEHDWLSGTGEATVDSVGRLQHYSGAQTTYRVEAERVTTPPDVKPIYDRFAALEAKNGAKSLSVRDTTRASIGSANFTVDYGRPLARGRQLVGGIIPLDHVWRTGANAATQFTTSAPITLAGLALPAGTYTLWTVPRADRVELIVNKQHGQWGTSYDRGQDLGRAPLDTAATAKPVEQFTISIVPTDKKHGTLAMEWGPFRWTAPIVVR